MEHPHRAGQLNGLAVGETARESQSKAKQGNACKEPQERGTEFAGMGE